MTWFIFGVVLGGFGGYGVARWLQPTDVTSFDDGAAGDAQQASAQAAIAARTQRRLDRIVAAATAAGQITNDGVEDLFCISDRTASNYLRTLNAQGRLKRQGSGRGTLYTPK